VGVAPNAAYRESRRLLRPDDLLVVYTDGVTEAADAGGHLFSEDRVAEIVRTDGARPAEAVVDRILAAVEAFEGDSGRADDITVLALRRLPTGSREAALAETVILRNELSELDRLDEILDRFGGEGRLPSSAMAELRIVCDEIVSNVIHHAYPQGGQHDIEVRLEMAGPRLTLTVSDDGVPFDPLAIPSPDTTRPLEEREPGGLGIHLVRSLAAEMSYARRDGRNVVSLVMKVRDS